MLCWHYPASTLLRPCPTPVRTAACRDVEVTPLAHHGSPSITRTTFPTCRAHYPGGSSGCVRRLLPRLRGLPQMAGGSASALSLSRPAQASLALRPAGLLSRPKRPLSRGSSSAGHPAKTARQLPDQSTTLRVESSSTDDSRLRGARPISDNDPVYSTLKERTDNGCCGASAWCNGCYLSGSSSEGFAAVIRRPHRHRWE